MPPTPIDDLLKYLASGIAGKLNRPATPTSTQMVVVDATGKVSTQAIPTTKTLIPTGPITVTETAQGIEIGSTVTGGSAPTPSTTSVTDPTY